MAMVDRFEVCVEKYGKKHKHQLHAPKCQMGSFPHICHRGVGGMLNLMGNYQLVAQKKDCLGLLLPHPQHDV